MRKELVMLLAAGLLIEAESARAQYFPPIGFGSVTLPDTARGVAVAWPYAYVADEDQGLRVVDISNPAAPAEIGYATTPSYAVDVAVAGAYAYVTDNSGGLRVIDISNPAAPSEVGFLDVAYSPRGVAVVGSYAYLACQTFDLRVIDISNPAAPVEVGGAVTPGNANNVAVAGSYAYVADSATGLRVVNISNPVTPVEVGFVDTPGYAVDVAVAGSYAYVADLHQGLRVIDVANPAAPEEVAHVALTDVADRVAVAGSYAYVAAHNSGLRVVDISNPEAPLEVTYFAPNAETRDVAVAGSFAYLVSNAPELVVVGISNSLPILVTNQTEGAVTADALSASRWVTTGFATDAGSHTLNMVALTLSGPLPVSVGVFADDGGRPGAELASLVRVGPIREGLPQRYGFLPASPLSLEAHTTYFIVARATSLEQAAFWYFTDSDSVSGPGSNPYQYGVSEHAGVGWSIYPGPGASPMLFEVRASSSQSPSVFADDFDGGSTAAWSATIL